MLRFMPEAEKSRSMSEFTQILERVEKGDAGAVDELLPLVYAELRRLAGQRMATAPRQHRYLRRPSHYWS